MMLIKMNDVLKDATLEVLHRKIPEKISSFLLMTIKAFQSQ